MARECKNCGNRIPYKIRVDGVQRNLGRRKYCLNCSPFGSHNTRVLHEDKPEFKIISNRIRYKRRCSKCGKTNWGTCHSCYQKERSKRVEDRVYSIVGRQCWLCHYNRGTEMLDFHHVGKKLLEVNRRAMASNSWSVIWEEIQRCMLLCCRCHRELEYGYIDAAAAEKIYHSRWETIRRGSQVA